MSLELDPAYGAYIGVNLYIDASDNATLYLDDAAVTPDGKDAKLIRDDNAGIYKLQYRCAVKDFAMSHSLVACDSGGNTIRLSLDQYTDVEEYTYSGKSYCDAVLAEGTNYSDELKDVFPNGSQLEYKDIRDKGRNQFSLEYNDKDLRISVIIPSKDNPDMLIKCIDNLNLKLLLYEDMGNVKKRLKELSLLN